MVKDIFDRDNMKDLTNLHVRIQPWLMKYGPVDHQKAGSRQHINYEDKIAFFTVIPK